jgi:hypothetical protein
MKVGVDMLTLSSESRDVVLSGLDSYTAVVEMVPR